MILTIGSSCEKSEPLYPKPNVPTGLQTKSFALGENYENQLWFDFETQSTASNLFGKWDIAFSCFGDPQIRICAGQNSSYSLAEIENVDFNEISPLHFKNAVWKFDNPNGNPDSTAFGKCFIHSTGGGFDPKNSIYLLDRGQDSLKDKRYVKIQLFGVRGGVYQFRWGFVSTPSVSYLTQLVTQPNSNFIYYSFSAKDTVNNEPLDRSKWDIEFTTYKEAIPDNSGQIFPYILRGVLINPNNIQVKQIDNGISYESCDLNFAKMQQYSANEDEIGYDWKTYNQTTGKYTMVPNRFYIIKTKDNKFFKLKFVDYYDYQGHKGNPKMAWQLIN